MIQFPRITEAEFIATEGAQLLHLHHHRQGPAGDRWTLDEGVLQNDGLTFAAYRRGAASVGYYVIRSVAGWGEPVEVWRHS